MEFFEEHRLSYVCVDVPPGFPSSLPPLTVATTELAVVRFHGRNGDAWERGADTGDDRMSYDYRRGDSSHGRRASRSWPARRSRSTCSSPPARPTPARATPAARARAHRGTPPEPPPPPKKAPRRRRH